MRWKKPILKKGHWSPQSLRVLRERYLRRDNKGRLAETPEEMIWRVAKEMVKAEKKYNTSDKESEKLTKDFYWMMINRFFLPNSPTLMNAGTGSKLQYAGCYVLPVEDSISGIFGAVKAAAVVHQSGGGTGFAFSRLRPQGDQVRKSGGVASGPVSFMKVFDAATEQVKQGGRRRGANMGVLRVDHPDVEDFITCKLDGGITNFNISVAVTDKFMTALDKGKDYSILAQPGWPKPGGGYYRGGERIGKKSARKVFGKIIDSAWRSGDPGIVWIDKINQGSANPVPSMGPVESTNPCGEQPLYPNESCNLGSINLGLMIKKEGRKFVIDWKKLDKVTRLAVRFLDDVIDVNPFPLEEIKESVLANRRIGLGVMGWADLLFQLGIAYDSRKAVNLAKKLMKFIDETAWDESEKIAQIKGPFSKFKKSIYKNGQPRRNSTVTTIAPTGSISIIANCSSGIEPIFALAFTHKSGKRILHFVNPYLKKALKRYKRGDGILRKIKEVGYLGQIDQVPKQLKMIFKTAHEINWRWHIRMQAAFQKYTDNAVSKTINLAREATKKDVKEAYLMAYRQGCNGVTVFRDGCKGEQVLTSGVKDKKEEAVVKFEIKRRPRVVEGSTYRIATPVGSAFVTVNHNGETDQPLEVFVSVGKAGSDIAADAEAIGRLISLCLRISPSDVSPKKVTSLIIDQLAGIGGGYSVGLGKEKVRSLADGIAQILAKHITNNGGGEKVEIISQQPTLTDVNKKRDICPSCGNATLVFEEGCAKCLSCGYSKC